MQEKSKVVYSNSVTCGIQIRYMYAKMTFNGQLKKSKDFDITGMFKIKGNIKVEIITSDDVLEPDSVEYISLDIEGTTETDLSIVMSKLVQASNEGLPGCTDECEDIVGAPQSESEIFAPMEGTRLLLNSIFAFMRLGTVGTLFVLIEHESLENVYSVRVEIGSNSWDRFDLSFKKTLKSIGQICELP